MNRHGVAELTAWGVAGLMLAASAIAWSTVVPVLPSSSEMPNGGRHALAVAPAPIDTAQLAADAGSLRDRDPFRWERQPPSARFNPWESAIPTTAATPAAPTKPVLALVGIVGGPPWTALLEGIPGREGGVLLRVGEEIGRIRLEAVRGDTARFSGFDTTWVLTTRRAWR